jgi:hypothetical protein
VEPADCSPKLAPSQLPVDFLTNPNKISPEVDLEKMFTYIQIKDWLNRLKGSTDETELNELETKITDSAIKHGFVTKFTSMVVTESLKEDLPIAKPIILQGKVSVKLILCDKFLTVKIVL